MKQWVNTHRSPSCRNRRREPRALAALLGAAIHSPLPQSLTNNERQRSEHVDAPKRR